MATFHTLVLIYCHTLAREARENAVAIKNATLHAIILKMKRIQLNSRFT